MMRRAPGLICIVVMAACARDSGDGMPTRLGLGRAATPQEIAAIDIAVGPHGAELPPGSGSVSRGESLYVAKCASCHGAHGEGSPPPTQGPALVGRNPKAENFGFGNDPTLVKTIGNYWPHATTVFDYVRRAMPLSAPGSLTNDEVYALTAYLLSANQVIPANTTLDAQTLRAVRMPYASRFVPDDRRGGHEVR